MSINEFCDKIGYRFRDERLLNEALTHSSYANEKKTVKHNERLEFLGDTVLSLIVSEYIFKSFPQLTEGEMSKLRASVVCEKTLFEVSEKIGLKNYLVLGKGEIARGGAERPSILADAVEALLAAIYLDSSLETARSFLLPLIVPFIDHPKLSRMNDYKTILQEITQQNHGEILRYELVGESGPDHAKEFAHARSPRKELYRVFVRVCPKITATPGRAKNAR